MRIESLNIASFGHFADQKMVFSEGGVQLIFGENEAGKTTLLEFLRGWLFDFERVCKYDFKSGTSHSGSGEIRLADGRCVELRRRKGARQKLAIKIDGQESDWGDEQLRGALCHANRHLFESVFAFGLHELSQGEASLKHESLQSALFGGGLGSSFSPDRIQSELAKQAEALFKPAGQNPAINAKLRRVKELYGQWSKKNLKSEDYHRCRESVESHENQSELLKRKVEELRADLARHRRLALAWPKWRELGQCQLDLQQVRVPAEFPADARSRWESLVERNRETLEQYQHDQAQLVDVQRAMESLSLNPELISCGSEIKRCLSLKATHVEASEQLPELERQISAIQKEVETDLQDLRPGWSLDELRRFRVTPSQRAELDALLGQHERLRNSRQVRETVREERRNQMRQVEAEFQALPPSVDTAELVVLLGGEAEYTADRKQVQLLQNELRALTRDEETKRRKLAPLLSLKQSFERDLPVLNVDTIQQYQAEFETAREELRSKQTELDRWRGEHHETEELVRELAASQSVPSLADLREARSTRDRLRQQLENFVRGLAAGETQSQAPVDVRLLDDLARATQEADHLADRIYEQADLVSKREAAQRRLAECDSKVRTADRRRDAATISLEHLMERWQLEWKDSGIEPLEPEPMLRWCTDYEQACEIALRREHLLEEIEEVDGRVKRFEERLLAVAGGQDVPVAILQVRERLDQAKSHDQQASQLRVQLIRLRSEIEHVEEENRLQSEAEQRWAQDWERWCESLQFPQGWGPDKVRMVVDRLETTRTHYGKIPDLVERANAMRRRSEEFASGVRDLCNRIDPKLTSEPAVLALDKLSDNYESASIALRQHETHRARLNSLEAQLALAQSRLQTLAVERQRWMELGGVTDEDSLGNVIASAEKKLQIETTVRQLEHELVIHCASDDRDEFERELATIDPDRIDGVIRDLEEQLERNEGAKVEADKEAAVARVRLQQLDESSEAVLLAETLAQERASLAELVNRYVPIVLAQHLLASSVKRFERDNQPEMISLTAELFEQMTDGRYVGFERSQASQGGILVRRSDGAERTPDQLSTGTREQLYLAIRLAYVKQYCSKHEPLPVVMDDVLVNFDGDRAERTLRVLADLSNSVQILFFTCHQHMIDLYQRVFPGKRPIVLKAPLPFSGVG